LEAAKIVAVSKQQTEEGLKRVLVKMALDDGQIQKV
jgi:hypothetical protein